MMLKKCLLILLIPWIVHQKRNSFDDSHIAEKTIIIYVVDNGLHTSIAVPLENKIIKWDTVIRLDYFSNDVDFQYLEFGWGDKEFYINTPTWGDLDFWTAIKALFWPTPSVMKVDGAYSFRESDHVASIHISDEKYIALTKFILNSFDLKENKEPLFVAPGYDQHSAFFKANGKYHLFNTSNTWTAKGLREINIKTPFIATSKGIIRKLKKSHP
jgi:uncharacterized protein (TIGR02117 family)